MLLLSAVATHFNARISVNRHAAAAVANPQANIMNKMMLWFFPIMILGTGVMWHVGLLTYMLTNNIWTFFQQYFLYKKMDREAGGEGEAGGCGARCQRPAPRVSFQARQARGK